MHPGLMVPHAERHRWKGSRTAIRSRPSSTWPLPFVQVRGVPGTVLERGAVTTLKHPITVFIIAVCCVIGLGVAVLATTGNGGLASALTCAPPTADQYGPPGAKFTSNFPGRVYLWAACSDTRCGPLLRTLLYLHEPKSSDVPQHRGSCRTPVVAACSSFEDERHHALHNW